MSYTQTVVPINPSNYIRQHNRNASKKFDVNSWFLDEKITVDFGEYVGRPSKNITLQKDYLSRFLENGWKIDAIVYAGEEGNWQSVSSNTFANKTGEDGSSTSSSYTTTESGNSTSSSETTATGTSSITRDSSITVGEENHNQAASSNTYAHSNSTNKEDVNNVSSSSSNTKNDTGSSSSNGSSSSTTETGSKSDGTESGDSTTTTEGPAYWGVVQRIRLVRRRMQPEYVLKDMISTYVNDYNNGIANEDARYNELVTLYSVVLNRNETEANELVSGALNVTGLFDTILSKINSTASAADESAGAISSLSLKKAEDEIMRAFDAKIAEARTTMIGNGTYNGTVWVSVAAGIERQRQSALSAARAEAAKAGADAQTSLLSVKGNVYAGLVNAKQSIASAIDARKTTAIELRNTIVKWMVDFMGSREDIYPQITEISALAQNIGFSAGASGSVL